MFSKAGSDGELEKGMATHSSILAWRIPWIEEPHGLQSMGVTRSLGHNRVTEQLMEKRLVVASGGEEEGRMELEVRVSRCELLFTEWRDNRILPYSTGTCIQYSVINHHEKDY